MVTALQLFSIHEVTPIKVAWLLVGLELIPVKALLALRLPWGASDRLLFFAIYLGASSLEMQRFTPYWNWGGELAMAIAAVAVTAECIFRVTILDAERRYGRMVICGIAGMVLGVGIAALPPSYVGFSSPIYYTALFSSVACLSALVGSLGYSWWGDTKAPGSLRWHNAILAVWFLNAMWPNFVGRQHWFEDSLLVEAIQYACLGAWFWNVAKSPSAVSAH